jgi:hypothetical protein
MGGFSQLDVFELIKDGTIAGKILSTGQSLTAPRNNYIVLFLD